jgi:hypothetical protein
MKVELWYQKNCNFLMDGKQARRLTMGDIKNNYAKVLDLDMPDGTLPDRVFRMYQERPIPLPAGVVHTSMSVGDIVRIGETVHICLVTGWFSFKQSLN